MLEDLSEIFHVAFILLRVLSLLLRLRHWLVRLLGHCVADRRHLGLHLIDVDKLTRALLFSLLILHE